MWSRVILEHVHLEFLQGKKTLAFIFLNKIIQTRILGPRGSTPHPHPPPPPPPRHEIFKCAENAQLKINTEEITKDTQRWEENKCYEISSRVFKVENGIIVLQRGKISSGRKMVRNGNETDGKNVRFKTLLRKKGRVIIVNNLIFILCRWTYNQCPWN